MAELKKRGADAAVLGRMEEFIDGGWGRELARRAALLPARAGPSFR